MSKKLTKDLNAAMLRLEFAAPHLICVSGLKYGGSIEADLRAVLRALQVLRNAKAKAALPSGERA